jgi:hypothetical protein
MVDGNLDGGDKNAEEILSNNYPSYSHIVQTVPSQ